MATVGQQLLTPESGWKRYDDRDALIQYIGTGWTDYTGAGGYNGSIKISKTQGDAIRFNFTGKKIRIITLRNIDWGTNIQISIDGISKFFSAKGSQLATTLVFEELNLDDREHLVEIKKGDGIANLYIGLDAIDIDINGALLSYNEDIFPFRKRLSLKNPTTNERYSLDDKTLIPLPDSSNKNMILYGIEQGREIQLDEPFNKIKHPSFSNEALGNGKVFKTTINTQIPFKNITVEQE